LDVAKAIALGILLVWHGPFQPQLNQAALHSLVEVLIAEITRAILYRQRYLISTAFWNLAAMG